MRGSAAPILAHSTVSVWTVDCLVEKPNRHEDEDRGEEEKDALTSGRDHELDVIVV